MKKIPGKNVRFESAEPAIQKKSVPQFLRESTPVHFSLNRDWLPAIIIIAVTLWAYYPAWNGKPVWDDDAHITKPELRSIEGLARIWIQPGAAQQYYPLVHTVFWVHYHLWGDSTLGYHLFTILMHLIATFLVLLVLRRLAIRGAWFAAMIFALHPIQAESVAWISELKNTLSAVFFLGSVLVYLRFDTERKRKLYGIALGLFILGLLSKSAIAPLPVALLVIFWWKRGRLTWKHDVMPLLPFIITGMASGCFTAWMEQKFIIGPERNEFHFTFIERCLIAGRAFWFYPGKIFWPVNLIFIYPRWNISQTAWHQYLFPVAALMLLGAFWALRRRWRAPLTAFLFYAAMLFPVLGFFNAYPFRFSFVADHFQYLAGLGPTALAAAGTDSILRLVQRSRRLLKTTIFVMVSALLGALTWKQSRLYADAATLYQTTLDKNPGCWMAHFNLGTELSKKGRFHDAGSHFRTSLKLNPDNVIAHVSLGNALVSVGHTGEGIAEIQKALDAASPAVAVNARISLGNALLQSGRIDEGIEYYRKALEIDPVNIAACVNLGNALMQSGRVEEGMTRYRQALKLNDRSGDARGNLGFALMQIGNNEEAVWNFRRALETDPDNLNWIIGLWNAVLRCGRPMDAVEIARRGVAIAKTTGRESRAMELENFLEQIGSAGTTPLQKRGEP